MSILRSLFLCLFLFACGPTDSGTMSLPGGYGGSSTNPNNGTGNTPSTGCADGTQCTDPLWCINGSCQDPSVLWTKSPKLPTKIVISSFELGENITSFEGSAWTDTLSMTASTVTIAIDGIKSTYDFFRTEDGNDCTEHVISTVTLSGHLTSDVSVPLTGNWGTYSSYNSGYDKSGPVDLGMTMSGSTCDIMLTPIKRAKVTTPISFLNGVIRDASFGQGFLYDVACYGGNAANYGWLYIVSTLDGCGTIQDYSDAPIGFYGHYIGGSKITCCDGGCKAHPSDYSPICTPEVGFPTYLSLTNKLQYVGTFRGNWQIAMEAPDPNWTLINWTGSFNDSFAAQ